MREAGFEKIKLFDTTLYRTQEISTDEIRAKYLQLKKWDFSEKEVQLKQTDVYEDFEELVKEFDPHIIASTMVEVTWEMTMKLLRRVRYLKKPTIIGGVVATFEPEEVLAHDCVDMICVGEGERAFVELCQRMASGEDYTDIPNIWVKTKEGISKNPLRELIDINELPPLDFTIFDEKRFYRPQRGKIVKLFPLETSRGCPYRCSFCCASAWAEMFSNQFYRKREPSKVFTELKYQRDKGSMEFIYFSAETFLDMSNQVFESFVERYEEINLPFWFQTRPETIREDRLKKLQQFDFHLSIGIESGSENFRNKVLNRRNSNEAIINAMHTLNRLGVKYAVNNIVGFPDETREDIFETIELNRKCNVTDVNVFIFTPYRGTKLRQVCVDKGYIPPDHIAHSHILESTLKMPQISSEEIYGLYRTFVLYVKLPKKYWPDIRRAETFDDEGNAAYEDLAKFYREQYQTD